MTGMQFDNISKTYAAENKQVRLGKKFIQWWLQILDISVDRGKEALLSIEPTNEIPSTLTKVRKIPRMHIITEDRHAELLRAERQNDILLGLVESLPTGLEDLLDEEEVAEFNR